MLEHIQKRGQATRILLAAIIGVIALSMLITLLPGSATAPSASPDVVVEVGGQPITATDVRRQISLANSGRNIPAAFEHVYASQFLDQLITERIIEVEAERLGIRVTRQEQADRIRAFIPAAKSGDMQQYAVEVQQRTQMTVPDFENAVRKMLLAEKFAQMVTDGITATPQEISEEYRRRNEKITIDYALVSPDELESKISVSEADLAAHYEKAKASYQVPERRSIRYALLDSAQARSGVSVTDAEARAYYDANIDQYRHQSRAKVRHILLKTVGKGDAEVAEIRAKMEDVLKQARGKAKFEDLAKQHSEDGSKDNGGDLGWITPGQTVPAFDKAAFSMALNTVSDIITTEYGFHIIKVEQRENARTQSFEEVRGSILPILTAQKADRAASDIAEKISATVRQNPRMTLDDLAKQFKMTIGEAGPSAARDAWGALGPNTQLDDSVFRLRENELSAPIQMPTGFAVLALTKVEPAHQGTLAEVRSRVEADVRRERAGARAKEVAEQIAAAAKGGNLAAAAKAAGITVKKSESFARTGSLPDIGSPRPIAAAFSMNVGDVGPATSLGVNWVVYRVASKEAVNAAQAAQQIKEVEQAVLQSKRQLAFESFQEALKDRLTKEGVIKYNQDNLRRLTQPRS